MPTKILVFVMTLVTCTTHSQTAGSSRAENHIAEVIKELPVDSELRRDLLRGARGNGVHYPWMDSMRQQKIKRVIVWIDILFDKKGRPRKISLNKTQYFETYEGGEPVSDTERLKRQSPQAAGKMS